jgi:hypothetical protein
MMLAKYPPPIKTVPGGQVDSRSDDGFHNASLSQMPDTGTVADIDLITRT